MNYTCIVGFFVSLLFSCGAFAQCVTGNERSCKCETAEILCSADELDGYSYSMSEFEHPEDGPNQGGNLCGTSNTISNNPTWFAFTAWCTDLEIAIEVRNCSLIYDFLIVTRGIQLAIYDGCEKDANYIACDLNCSSNIFGIFGDEEDRNVSMTNLTIGKKYYMVVDGCAGSACDIKINIIGDCGATIVEAWEEDIVGPKDICVGDAIDYTMEALDGANRYHWFVNSTEEQVSESTNFSRSFNLPGIYKICADASNDPCIDISEKPDRKCKTIQVHESIASTLDILGDTNCPNDNVIIKGTTQNDIFFSTGLVVVNDMSEVVLSQYAVESSFIPGICGEFKVYLIIAPDNELDLPQVGDIFDERFLENDCFDHEKVDLIFTDSETPQFITPPNDTTISCIEDIPQMQSLAYMDNCLGMGNVMGLEVTFDDSCYHMIERYWSVVDSCGNENTHTQRININPKENLFMIDDVPQDESLICGADIPDMDSLSYIHPCEGKLQVIGVESGSFTICEGGQLVRTWHINEPCFSDTTFQQIITIEPKRPAQFDYYPQDTILTCEEYKNFSPQILRFGKNSEDLCEDNGSIEGSYSLEIADCDAMSSIVWDAVDRCGNRLYHLQNVIIEPKKYIDTEIGAPNIFNPAQGNFTIYANDGVRSIKQLSIYDRWGSKVFIQEDFLPNDNSLGWNGRYNDNSIVQGVYTYRASITYQDGSREIMIGNITVVQ